MSGIPINELLTKTESEISLLVEIGEEIYRQNKSSENLLIDMLDFHFAHLEYLINSAHFQHTDFKKFLYLKHDDRQQSRFTDEEVLLDAKIQNEAQKLAKEITKSRFKNILTNTNKM